jgi:hypothetical protein
LANGLPTITVPAGVEPVGVEPAGVEEVLARGATSPSDGEGAERLKQERQRRASSQSRSSTGSRCSPGCEARASQVKWGDNSCIVAQ